MYALKDVAYQACLPVIFLLLLMTCSSAQKIGYAELVYQWKFLDFDWPSENDQQESLKNGSYIPERCLLTGIKVYKGAVFLTIPRWIWTSGIPVTLAKVVTIQGTHKLKPYPNMAAQKPGDCNALQYVQSMEIDPNTGYMYVIDTGRIGDDSKSCPAKIVVYDINSDKEVDRYVFPSKVANSSINYLNDIVLDYVDGRVQNAYITNTWQKRIVVYNFQKRTSSFIQDPTMSIEGNKISAITINGKDYALSVDVDGIAMSSDFKYVYYTVLSGHNLYQIPTSTLRSGVSVNTGIRSVGKLVSHMDGMAHGSKHLFYGALGLSAVYYWDSEKDIKDQNVSIDKVTLATQKELAQNSTAMQWPDTFGFDENGWLWVVANRLQDVFGLPSGIPKDEPPFNNVWKIYVNETSYLYEANMRTKTGNSGSSFRSSFMEPRCYLVSFMIFVLELALTSP